MTVQEPPSSCSPLSSQILSLLTPLQALKFQESAHIGAAAGAGQIPQDVQKLVNFEGSLCDLLKICHHVEAGTIIDLGDATVEGVSHIKVRLIFASQGRQQLPWLCSLFHLKFHLKFLKVQGL
jgi:hypothetical protein